MLGLVVRVSHALFSVVKNFSLCVSFWLCWSGFSLVAVRGLLISVASPVAEHRLQSSGSAVVAYGLSCSVAYGLFQEPGIKLVFPALAGGFFTTEPPGKVKEAQSCLTLCDPMDYTVHGILQARILEWVAFPFSRGSSHPGERTQVSCLVGRFFTS